MSSGSPPRWSSQTIDTRRAVAISRLLAAWEKVPEKKLGELIVEALANRLDVKAALSQLENDELLEAIERSVLIGG